MSTVSEEGHLARLRIFGLSDSGNAVVGSQRTASRIPAPGATWHPPDQPSQGIDTLTSRRQET